MRLYFTSISSKHLKKAKESQRLKELTACGLQKLLHYFTRKINKDTMLMKKRTQTGILCFFLA